MGIFTGFLPRGEFILCGVRGNFFLDAPQSGRKTFINVEQSSEGDGFINRIAKRAITEKVGIPAK